MSILIQYEGLVVAQTSRDYNFLMIDALRESHQFTVKVPLGLFRSTSLQYQDGPSICYEILQKELDSETQESLAKLRLNVGEQDLQEYMTRHYLYPLTALAGSAAPGVKIASFMVRTS